MDDSEVRDELVQRAAVDQAARRAVVAVTDSFGVPIGPDAQALISELERVDADNTAWLQDVLSVRGWPTQSQVGREAAQAAWLLVQHADRDPGFQRECLDRMSVLDSVEVDGSLVAYLTDRVSLAQGLSQVFGTQLENVDGVWRPRNLRDPDNVDQRRATVGLSTIAEYLDMFVKHQQPENNG
jgi:hypothetical protein